MEMLGKMKAGRPRITWKQDLEILGEDDNESR